MNIRKLNEQLDKLLSEPINEISDTLANAAFEKRQQQLNQAASKFSRMQNAINKRNNRKEGKVKEKLYLDTVFALKLPRNAVEVLKEHGCIDYKEDTDFVVLPKGTPITIDGDYILVFGIKLPADNIRNNDREVVDIEDEISNKIDTNNTLSFYDALALQIQKDENFKKWGKWGHLISGIFDIYEIVSAPSQGFFEYDEENVDEIKQMTKQQQEVLKNTFDNFEEVFMLNTEKNNHFYSIFDDMQDKTSNKEFKKYLEIGFNKFQEWGEYSDLIEYDYDMSKIYDFIKYFVSNQCIKDLEYCKENYLDFRNALSNINGNENQKQQILKHFDTIQNALVKVIESTHNIFKKTWKLEELN